MSPTMLNGPELKPKSGTTKRLVIFLHGYGSDGNDLISLAPMLGLEDTHFASPNAPLPCEMGPYGFQWFSLLDRSPEHIVRGIQKAEPILNAYIDAQMTALNLTPKDVALIGFSQGSMMSLFTAPRRAEPLAGIVGISGALHGAELLSTDLKSRPPICLIHGTHDEVVPFAAMGLAESAFKQCSVPVSAHARPGLGHGIDEEGIAITSAFLRRVFGI